MIKIHRDNRVIFWLLIGGFVLNILWSFRLELQAKATKTIVEKYHRRLNANRDELYQLEHFIRTADGMHIGSSDTISSIIYNSALKHLQLYSAENEMLLGNVPGTGVGIRLRAGIVGKHYTDIHQDINRIHLGMDSDHKMPYFTMDSTTKMIGMGQDDSLIYIGKHNNVPSIKISVGNTANLGIFKGKATQLGDDKLLQLISNDRLDIVAKGDINIVSKNGVVRINGKKIHLKEKPKWTKEQEKAIQEASRFKNPFLPWLYQYKNKAPKAKGRPTLPPKLKSIPVPLDEPTGIKAKKIPLEDPPEAKWVPLEEPPQAKEIPLEKDDPNDPPHRLKPYQGPYSTE